MKRLTKGIVCVALVGLLSVGGVACSETISAYDIAVQNGFVGTETEWLLSLRGANGADGQDLDAKALYEEAKAEGYEGSFLDFCALLNISVAQNNDTAQIAQNMLSVVSIYCGYSVTTSSGGRPSFLGGVGGATISYGSQAGSGVIVSLNKEAGNAYILTNYHVVYNLDSDQQGILENIYVYPYGAYNDFDAEKGDVNGDGIKATYVGGAMDYDIAILKVEGSEYLQNSEVTVATIGNSNDVQVGEKTFVIGNPEGAGISVTNGVISVASEYITMSALDNNNEAILFRVMRTSAAINGGNSGGGMFNADGELIGIVNAKSAGTTTDNMGYALPITQVKAIYDNILENEGTANEGKVAQATLGISVATTGSKAVVDTLGQLSIVEEFCVAQEADAGAASYQKLHVGDVFLSAKVNDGEKVTFTRKYQLTDLLLTVRKGQTVTFTVRNASGVEKEVAVTFDKDDYFTIYG